MGLISMLPVKHDISAAINYLGKFRPFATGREISAIYMYNLGKTSKYSKNNLHAEISYFTVIFWNL